MAEDLKKELWIAVDFDGTLTTIDAWPDIAPENPYAIDVIKRFKREGHKVILNTCRRNEPLRAAVEWMTTHGIEPDAVNDNPWARAIYNDPDPGTKVFAHVYIDDRNIFIKKTKTGSVDFKYIKRNYKRLINSL
jgi:hypothetical protein